MRIAARWRPALRPSALPAGGSGPVTPENRGVPTTVASRLLALLVLAVLILSAWGLTRSSAQPVSQTRTSSSASGLLPTQPSSLWLGDSYTAGTGAPGSDQAESCLTATTMHWICNLDAEGGTGFVANGHANSPSYTPLFKRLAADHRRFLADVIVIDDGRNDGTSPAAVPAARKVIATVRRYWPRAHLVFIAPYFMDHTGEVAPALASYERRAAARLGATFIDPNREGWISAARTGKLTISDGVHPNPQGHLYIADHLIADLRRAHLTNVPVTDDR